MTGLFNPNLLNSKHRKCKDHSGNRSPPPRRHAASSRAGLLVSTNSGVRSAWGLRRAGAYRLLGNEANVRHGSLLLRLG